MKKIFILFFGCLFFIAACAQDIKVDSKFTNTARKLDTKNTLQTIAFGSCNNQGKSQEMWKHVVKNKPDLWIWLGDIIYADTKNMQVMADKYSSLKNNMDYRRLLACSPVIGIWDDHDFGWNDAGKEYPMKNESKRLLLDFLDVPKDTLVRAREGIYQSYVFGEKGKKIKIILLDTRFFRDNVERTTGRNKRYIVNNEGDVLGDAQWVWLEKELESSDAQINIIASGYQIISKEHRFAKWGNFPKARARLFKLLQKVKPAMPILITGDRHIAELSRTRLVGLENPLFEITSSGLTHTWSEKRKEANQYRVGDLIIEKNFGLFKIDWSGEQPKVTVEVRGLNNVLFLKKGLF
ncbi:MAG: alkaline phosphatase D family protein [Saprospiraceae bacterium]|nr:alkaline phosphatase D family protein [Saprospiraceae bacterium]